MSSRQSDRITNRSIIDKYRELNSIKETANYIISLHPNENLKEPSLRSAIRRAESKLKNFQKNKSRLDRAEFDAWLDDDFKLPEERLDVIHEEVAAPPPPPASATAKATANPMQPQILTRVAAQCAETEQKKRKIEDLEDRNEELEVKIDAVQSELKRLRVRETYHRRKSSQLLEQNEGLQQQMQTTDKDREHTTSVELELCASKEKLKEIRTQNTELLNTSIMLEESAVLGDVINTYDDSQKCFTTAMRELIYQLLTMHVGTAHVPGVIKAVLDFAGLEASRLPSATTVKRMNAERLALAQYQIAATVPQMENTTLYSDETSKYGDRYMGYHLTDKHQNHIVLGLREIPSKHSDVTLNTFLEVISDFEEHATSNIARTILANISNTMSDRAATETKWHDMLEDYRKTILPLVIDNYAELTEDEKAILDRLSSFNCGLHSYVQMAECASASLKEIETDNPVDMKNGQLKKETESGVARLVRTCSKAFARGADEKNGCFGEFNTFIAAKLKDSKMSRFPMVKFRGNRFNILFFSAGHVYFFHNDMISFLSTRGSNNKLLNVVLGDLSVPQYIGGCKALSAIDKFVTAPLWRIIENKDVKIAQMGKITAELTTALEQVDIQEFLHGKFVGSEVDQWIVKEDKICRHLITSRDNDTEATVALSVILPAICQLLKEHYSSLLPGGEFADMTEEEKRTTTSVEKHNKFAERVFTYVDQLIRCRPNISVMGQTAYVMFCLNKTGGWIKGMKEEEKASIIQKAMRDRKALVERYKRRKEAIVEQKRKNLEEKIQKEEERKVKQQQDRELYLRESSYFGFYQTEDQMKDRMERITGRGKVGETMAALKSQLRFRQYILKQDYPDKTIFKFSEKKDGKSTIFTQEELKANVIT